MSSSRGLALALLLGACAAPPASFRGLAACGPEVWISGSAGTVWRSGPRGAFVPVLVPGAAELDFRDLECLPDGSVLLMSAGPGARSRLLRSSDGGATWLETLRGAAPEDFFDSIAFWDGQRGLLVGDPTQGALTVLRTGDGGRTWERAWLASAPGELCFAASGSSVCVQPGGLAWIATGGSTARVWRSSDWGRSWTAADTPLRAGPSAGIFPIAFRDPRHGVVVGGDYLQPAAAAAAAAWSEDGGVTWHAGQARGYRSCAAPLAGGVWLATGPGGTDVSHDGGRTWQPIQAEGFHVTNGVWLAGDRGRVRAF